MSTDRPPSRESTSAETLENSYVHLAAQLLLQLQDANTTAALQTAAAIRALCMPAATRTGAMTAAQGAQLFRGSPAELLLAMRSDLATLSSGSDAGSASSTATSDDEALLPSSDDNDDDAAAGIKQGTHAMQPQRDLSLLAGALSTWPRLPPVPIPPSPPPTASTSVRAPSPPSPLTEPQSQRRRPVAGHLGAEDQTGGTGAEVPIAPCNSGERGADTEAVETWECMQQRVAKEMERLAVVRKHR